MAPEKRDPLGRIDVALRGLVDFTRHDDLCDRRSRPTPGECSCGLGDVLDAEAHALRLLPLVREVVEAARHYRSVFREYGLTGEAWEAEERGRRKRIDAALAALDKEANQ